MFAATNVNTFYKAKEFLMGWERKNIVKLGQKNAISYGRW